jgi:hypothetical protein
MGKTNNNIKRDDGARRSQNKGISLQPATANEKKRTLDEVLVKKEEEGKKFVTRLRRGVIPEMLPTSSRSDPASPIVPMSLWDGVTYGFFSFLQATCHPLGHRNIPGWLATPLVVLWSGGCPLPCRCMQAGWISRHQDSLPFPPEVPPCSGYCSQIGSWSCAAKKMAFALAGSIVLGWAVLRLAYACRETDKWERFR